VVHPKQFSFYPEYIPEELKSGEFWVCCDWEKAPLIPWDMWRGHPRYASSTNPDTWRPFDEAVAAFRAHPTRYAGVGRVITAWGEYTGIDLDGIRDPKSRQFSPWALKILEDLNSYSEVSPSGRGVKIWTKAGAGLERSHVKDGLEVYKGGRYFTVTGTFLPQFPLTVEERTFKVVDLVEREFRAELEAARRTAQRGSYDGPHSNLEEYLGGVEVLAQVADSAGLKYLIQCPWISEHTTAPETGCYVGQRDDGPLWFYCHHSHCAGRRWGDFKKVASRERTLKADMPGYTGPDMNVRIRFGK